MVEENEKSQKKLLRKEIVAAIAEKVGMTKE